MLLRSFFPILALLCLSRFEVHAADAEALAINHQESSITVAVDSTAHDFTGTLSNYTVKIIWDAGAPLPYIADLSFDFGDLKTGDSSRDKDMLKWLDYSTNRIAEFHLTGWKKTGTNTLAQGELEFHGAKKSIEMSTVIDRQNNQCDITGSVKLDYRDFGLPVIRKLLVLKVSPRLTVKFHLIGTFAPPK